MTPTVILRTQLFGGAEFQARFSAFKLQTAGGLPSGKVFHWEMKAGDVQKERRLIRPYYRRVIHGELNIFAVQVMPKEEKRHGK